MPIPVIHPLPPLPVARPISLYDVRRRNAALAARNSDFIIATTSAGKGNRRGFSCNCCKSVCTCTVKICVTGCGGGNIPGALVTIKTTPGGAFVGSCITDNKTGCCTICLPAGIGTYEFIVTAQGYNTYDSNVTLTACGQTVNITLTPVGATPPCFLFVVTGCCGIALPGARVTVNGTNLTTGATGEVSWCSPGPGTYGWTVTGPSGCDRFISQSGSITVLNCSYVGNTIICNLQPQAGYVCGFNGPYPVPTSLNLTDSAWSSCTLTYDAVSGTFTGTSSGNSYPAETYSTSPFPPFIVGCPAGTFTIYYTLFPSANCDPPGLDAGYNEAFCGQCAAGFFRWSGAVVPDDTFGTVPCAPSGNPVLGCLGVSPSFCESSGGCTFTNPDGWDACPLDLTYHFAANPPCPAPGCCSPGGAHINPTSPCQCAVWTNFGPGTITITE